MGKKYILEPDGRIRDSETGIAGEIIENPEAESTDVNILTPIKNSVNVAGDKKELSSDLKIFDTLSSTDIFSADSLDFIGDNDDSNFRTEMDVDEKYNKSFDFLRKENDIKDFEKKHKSFYTPFNYILDANPQDFVTEFEILTGTRLVDGPNGDENSFDSVSLMFNYFATITTQILTIEGIILVNNAAQMLASGDPNVSEQHNLYIGKYNVNDYDIATRYITNVLNYPWKKSTPSERLSAFFVGFNEWTAPESILDISAIIKDTTRFENNYDMLSSFPSADPKGGQSNERKKQFELIGINFNLLTPLLVASLEQIIEGGLNYTHVKNRFKLLTRKFRQQSYWKNSLLDNAKLTSEQNDGFSNAGFFTQLNYYFIKFYIERVQVGLKILNKYVLDDSYLQMSGRESPINRVSASRSKNTNVLVQNTITGIDKAANYTWKAEDARDDKDTKGRIAPQTTNLRSLPQLFQSHNQFINSILLNAKEGFHVNSVLTKSFRQNFYKSAMANSTTGYRIPKEAVKAIENNLEAEYMPFYFHDVRTNEVISFHAFIESISDSFSPEYNTSSGFGRIDDVRSYVKTTRNINLSFTIAATSPEDHDLMWYQINKLVSMVYPQWSDGYDANTAAGSVPFKYPFTQVPTASPLIRLRVGDVIKSNYSRSSLSRLHGIGYREKQNLNGNTFTDDQGIPNLDGGLSTKFLMPGKYRVSTPISNAFTDFTDFLVKNQPAYVNLHHEVEIKKIKESLHVGKGNFVEVLIKHDADKIGEENEIYVVADASKIYEGYNLKSSDKATKKSTITGFNKYQLTPETADVGKNVEKALTNPEIKRYAKKYPSDNVEQQITDELTSRFTTAKKDATSRMNSPSASAGQTLPAFFNNPLGTNAGSQVTFNISDSTKAGWNKEKSANVVVGTHNPITKSYESGMSRGLAGFITQLDVNYNEVNWEVGRIGSKAPMLVKITLNYAPVHDIPPGLDHTGMMRAPVYNVGRALNSLYGDPHDAEYIGEGRVEALKKYELFKFEDS